MKIFETARRPLSIGVVLALAVLAPAQLQSFGDRVIDKGQVGQSGSRTGQSSTLELRTKPTPLIRGTKSSSRGGLVAPRSFFPMVNKSASPKSIMPENPSLSVPPKQYDRIIQDGRTLAPFGRGNGGRTFDTGKNGSTVKSGGLFPGIGFTGSHPPDTHAAAGPDHVVEVVNVSIGFLEKNTGQLVFQSSFDSGGFLANSGIDPTVSAFDPRVVYDKEAGRFYAMILDIDFENELSYYILCVSTTSNPLDPWVSYKIDNTATDTDDNPFWGDYPQIGFNGDLIVVSVNYFAFDPDVPGAFTGFSVVDKSTVLAGQPVASELFFDTGIFNARPAPMYGVSDDPCYAIGHLTDVGTDGIYRFYSFENNGGVNEAFSGDITVPNHSTNFGSAGPAPAPGHFVDAIPGRVMDATHSLNRLGFARTVGFSGGGNDRNAVAWGELTMNNFPVGNPVVRQSGLRAEAGGLHAYQPALATNVNGDTSIIYTRSSATRVPEVVVAVRKETDPFGTLSDGTVVASSANYTGAGPFVSRWGDYASVMVDPLDDRIFWGCNEVAIGPDPNFFGQTLWDTVVVSWLIPAGASIVDASPDTITPFYGSNAGGNLASFFDVDDDFYDVNTETINGRGEYAAYELTFQSPETQENTERLEVIASCSVTGVPAAGYMYAYNVNTGRWDLRRTFRVGNDLTQASFRVQNGAQAYTDENGVIRVRIMAFQALRRIGGTTQPFMFRTDDVSANINTSG